MASFMNARLRERQARVPIGENLKDRLQPLAPNRTASLSHEPSLSPLFYSHVLSEVARGRCHLAYSLAKGETHPPVLVLVEPSSIKQQVHRMADRVNLDALAQAQIAAREGDGKQPVKEPQWDSR